MLYYIGTNSRCTETECSCLSAGHVVQHTQNQLLPPDYLSPHILPCPEARENQHRTQNISLHHNKQPGSIHRLCCHKSIGWPLSCLSCWNSSPDLVECRYSIQQAYLNVLSLRGVQQDSASLPEGCFRKLIHRFHHHVKGWWCIYICWILVYILRGFGITFVMYSPVKRSCTLLSFV